eukprot:jgi/Tetstr1/463670/TSEL_008531.t1
MTIASFSDFFDDRNDSQAHNGGYNNFTSRSWTLNWFKDTSAEVQIYLYIELHKASLLTGKDFFDDPKGPLLACRGKIKDLELDSAGRYGALRGFADGTINIDDLANIDKDFENALPYVDTFAVRPALNGFSNTGAVDTITYGHLKVKIVDPEVKTSHGGDINTLYADRVNLVTDKDTGLHHIFSFPSDKFVAPPHEFEFRSPKLQDCNMVAQSYKTNPSMSAENFSQSFPIVHKNGNCYSEEYEPLALTMTNFKDPVAAFEGGEKPRREAKRMVKENYPEIYETNKGIRFTSDKMYIGLSPEVCRYMSMNLNEAGHTVVGDTSMHKLLARCTWWFGLLIQGEHNATPNLYKLVDDVKHDGDKSPMVVTHTNTEWLAVIETRRFRDLLHRASIKVMNAIDTAKGREAIRLLTQDEPARNWGKYLSDHIIDWDVEDKVSGQQAVARLDAITNFRAKADDLGPTGFPRKFQDLSKEHIAATNTNIRCEAYRIKNQMPDLVMISFFTEFALLACAPELIAVSAPNVSDELWILMKGEEVDKDDRVWLNTEPCKTCIVEGEFKAPATKQFVADAMSAVCARKATVVIADALLRAGSHTWDSKDAAWGTDDFNDVFAFAKQDTPHNPGT